MNNYTEDEIESITYIGEEETIDINCNGNRLFYANDILTHNSAVDEVEFDHSHISGGISKINTADNVFGIFTSRAMRERGKYQLQLLKTRSSSGIGTKVELDFNVDSLRIVDAGTGEEDSGIPPSVANSILSKIKPKSTTTTAVSQTEAEITGKGAGEINAARLKSMISGLGAKK